MQQSSSNNQGRYFSWSHNKSTRRIQVHGSKQRKETVRRSWYLIPIPDIVIDRFNKLGGDQPKQLTFTDRHGHLIGDI